MGYLRYLRLFERYHEEHPFAFNTFDHERTADRAFAWQEILIVLQTIRRLVFRGYDLCAYRIGNYAATSVMRAIYH